MLLLLLNSQPVSVLLHLPDGQQIPLEYDSVSTAAEAMDQIKARIGMRLDADGYGIFESSAGGWGNNVNLWKAECTLKTSNRSPIDIGKFIIIGFNNNKQMCQMNRKSVLLTS